MVVPYVMSTSLWRAGTWLAAAPSPTGSPMTLTPHSMRAQHWLAFACASVRFGEREIIGGSCASKQSYHSTHDAATRPYWGQARGARSGLHDAPIRRQRCRTHGTGAGGNCGLFSTSPAFVCVSPARGEAATVHPPLVPRFEAVISAWLSLKGSIPGRPWSVSAVESQARPAQTDHVRAEDLV
jgi:hypothetical protein